MADLNDVGLQMVENRLGKIVKPMAFEIIKERDTELFLIRALNNPEVRLQNRLLLRLQITEQVGLNRRRPSEGCILLTFGIN